MRGKGISYDTGIVNRGASTRELFDPEVVRRELRIIRDDLHCNAVRIVGGDPDRLETAATYAADVGLEVWFSPFTMLGTATYRGAGDRGAQAHSIVEWDADTVRPLRLNGDHARDEQEQARYLRELLEVFDAEGVDSTFVFTFVSYALPHRDDPLEDLDVASYGIVKVLEGRVGDTYPDWPGSPRPRSPPWPAATVADPMRGFGLLSVAPAPAGQA